jgi:NTP pyrophosphatase (non-canonical NTP hydrolase)
MKETADECFKISKKSGWWEEFQGEPLTRTEIAAKLCLIHSEVSEALEDARNPELDLAKVYVKGEKPTGFPSELADIIIRVFDLCGYMNIDIEEMVKIKMKYNEGRQFRHGGKAL